MTRPAPGHPLLTRRSSGVLLHLTSLPGRHGSGDLGVAARHFVDWLALAGQTLWQILPLTPPGAGQLNKHRRSHDLNALQATSPSGSPHCRL